MSNFRAVAHVMAAVQYRLSTALDASGEIPGAIVELDAPDEPSTVGSPRIRLFAYHVVPNAAQRGNDLPTRNLVSGAVVRRPTVALDVHFLLSFYGTRTELVPERLLGFAASVLHAYPVLNEDLLADTKSSFLPSVSPRPLADSDLAEQADRIALSPLSLTLEDLTRLWGTLTSAPYVLSMAWQASCLLIDRPLPTRRALPVQTTGLTVGPMGGPFLTSVANVDSDQPITTASTIELVGKGLRDETTRIQIGSTTFSVHPTDDTVRSTSIRLLLASHSGVSSPYEANLTPGIHAVRVVHPVFRSNAVPLVIHPRITGAATFTAATFDGSGVLLTHAYVAVTGVVPALGEGQRSRLHLSRLAGDEQINYSLVEDAPPRSASTTLRFTLPAPSGTAPDNLYDILVATPHDWVVRVEVDGVFSIPGMAGGAYATPSVAIP